MHDEPRHGATVSMILAAVLVAAEAVALIGFAVLDLSDVHAERLALGIGTSVFLLAYAAGQIVVAAGLFRLRRWARGPLVFTQLVQLGLAWGLRDADPAWIAGVLGSVALVVLWCVLRPSTTERLFD